MKQIQMYLEAHIKVGFVHSHNHCEGPQRNPELL